MNLSNRARLTTEKTNSDLQWKISSWGRGEDSDKDNIGF